MKKSLVLIFLIILGGLVYITGLFTIVIADAGKYAMIAREIVENGEWLKITAHTEPYLQKPPLHFWLTAISFKLFGYSSLSYKLPTLLLSILGIYSTFRLGKLLYSDAVGKLAALFLYTSLVFFLFNMDVHTDTIFMTTITFSIWKFAEYIQKRHIINLILGAIGTAFAMLTKGPVGCAVIVFAVASHLIFTRNYKLIFRLEWILAAGIIVAIIFPYLHGLYEQFGKEGPMFYFWTNNAGRISGTYEGGNTDYSFYIHTLSYLLAPWTIIVFIALFLEFKSRISKKTSHFKATNFYTIGAIIPFFIIISIAKGKAPHYILPIIPLIYIIAAKWLNHICIEGNAPKLHGKIYGIQHFIIGLCWLLIFLIPLVLFPTNSVSVWAIIAILFLLTIILYKKAYAFERFIYTSIISIIALFFIINTHLYPAMSEYQSTRKASDKYNELAGRDDKLYNYRYPYYELFFYSKNLVTQLKKEDLKKIVNTPQSWIYTDQEGYDEIMALSGTSKKIWQWDHRHLSQPHIKFYIPAKRAESLEKMYLIKF
jgi:4-amino-4-deoxy-L-arabinose transferase-like glycosyltransferase